MVSVCDRSMIFPSLEKNPATMNGKASPDLQVGVWRTKKGSVGFNPEKIHAVIRQGAVETAWPVLVCLAFPTTEAVGFGTFPGFRTPGLFVNGKSTTVMRYLSYTERSIASRGTNDSADAPFTLNDPKEISTLYGVDET